MKERKERPLDAILRARLHMPERSRIRLDLIRFALHSIDGTSRTISGKPFFALQETEDLLKQLSGVTGTDLLQDLLRRNGGTKVLAHGLEHVPAHGPLIVASTHPTGMFDFVAHASALQQVRPDLKVVANQEVERFLGPDSVVSVDIDKKNRAKSPGSTYAAMQQHLENDGALLIFGSGRVPASKQGQLVEPDWRGGTSRISQICQVQIVPASVNARNALYYYRIRKLAEVLSCGDQNFGAMVGSLRYSAELLEKTGGAVRSALRSAA